MGTEAEAGAGTVLEVRGLSVCHGAVEAVTRASLRVGEGQIVTVIGPNGAGKTTLLSAIIGVLPSSGEIVFNGVPRPAPEVEQMVAAGMTLVPEKRELFAEMSIEDNLLLGAFRRYRPFDRAGRPARLQTMDEVFALFPRLKERRGQLAGTLSGGERQMLALGRALMARPRLLMLDEPSLGLAPLVVREIFRTIAALRERGVAILLVEQNARAALQVADHAYVLENGAITLQGPAQQLAQDPRVIGAYVGLGGRHQDRLSGAAQSPGAAA